MPTDLKTELCKLSKVSNIQAGLPPLIRGLPVLAILAGEAVAKATDSRNVIEERMLGTDEVVLLGASQKLPGTTNHEWARPGVRMMCKRCGDGQISPGSRDLLTFCGYNRGLGVDFGMGGVGTSKRYKTTDQLK